jgi:hypothetical protein
MNKRGRIKIAIGCYGGRRGNTIASLIRMGLRRQLGEDYAQEIEVCGIGHPNFAKGGLMPKEHVDALEQIVKDAPEAGEAAAELRGIKREPIKDIDQFDAVYAVDTYIQGEYKKLSREKGGKHIYTISEASGINHGRYGPDLDDTETPLHFVTEVKIPEKDGKSPRPGAPKSPKDATWYSLNGEAYKAGTPEARNEEAKDLVRIARVITRKIVSQYKKAG